MHANKVRRYVPDWDGKSFRVPKVADQVEVRHMSSRGRYERFKTPKGAVVKRLLTFDDNSYLPQESNLVIKFDK